MKIPRDDETSFLYVINGKEIPLVVRDRVIARIESPTRMTGREVIEKATEAFPGYERECSMLSTFIVTRGLWRYECAMVKRSTFGELVCEWGREEALRMISPPPPTPESAELRRILFDDDPS
jgi:hypothetical protein